MVAEPIPQPRAVIYVRVSTDKQEEEGTSLDTQEQRARAYCEAHGYSVVDVVRDVYSGAALHDRPGLLRVRRAIRERAYDVLVVYAVDRLSRNQNHIGIVLDELDRAGVALACVSEPFEQTAVGKFLLQARAFAGELEREKLRERTLRGRRAKAEAGRVHGDGIELFGYRRDKEAGVRAIYEPEAAIVRWLYEMVAVSGWSLRRLAADLNERGVPAPSQGKVDRADGRVPAWQGGTLGKILRRPEYRGEAVAWRWRQERRPGGPRRVFERDQSEWVRLPDATTPALVSPALWEQAQARISAANAAARTRNERRPYLLRGLVRCAICGRAMSPNVEHGTRRVYRCTSSATPSRACGGKRCHADTLEAAVWTAMERRIRQPELIAAEAERLRAAGPDPLLADGAGATQRELAKVERQQQKLLRIYLARDDDEDLPELVQRELARLERDQRRLLVALREIEERMQEQGQAVARLDELASYCQRVAERLATFGFAERRLALEAFNIRLVASGDDWRGEGQIAPTGDVVVLNPTT